MTIKFLSSLFSDSSNRQTNNTHDNGKYWMNMSYGIIATIIFALSLFPYTSIVRTPFDTQPWALIVSIVFAIVLIIKDKNIYFPRPLLILLAIVFYAGLVCAFDIVTGKSNLLGALRVYAEYVSVFTLAFIGYKTFAYINVKIFFIAIGAWFMAGAIQFIFGARVLIDILPRISTGGYRGLTSLAPEPALYAAFCVALLVLNEFFYINKKYKTLIYLGIFFLLALQIISSYSGVGVMTLILLGLAKIIQLIFFKEIKKEKVIIFITIIIIIMSIGIFFRPSSPKKVTNNPIDNITSPSSPVKEVTPSSMVGSLSETRAGHLLKDSVTNPVAVFQKDLSVSRRLANPVLGIYAGLIKSHGLGMGLAVNNKDTMPAWLTSLLGENRTYGAFGGKTEGGLVATIYELGIIGLLFTCTILWVVFYSVFRKTNVRPALLVSTFALFGPMFLFGPIAFPLFGYILGVHLYYLYNDK